MRPAHPPGLTKMPLVKWDSGTRYLDVNHHVSPKTVAAETGVLLHFKFLHDFHKKAIQEAQREEYFDGASEYKIYARLLEGKPDLTLGSDHSLKYKGDEQLLELKLIQDSEEWRHWRARSARAPAPTDGRFPEH